ncbi:MAG: cobalamin B12-binding domain-containing protein [Planctomycetota bacterium]|jgi:methylmalonyl-CoA mutase C-terminal domain/subunit
MSTERAIRILIAKPGLDGHDQGAKVLVRALIDAGFEVMYTGLRQSADAIVDAARENEADVIGLSIMSGAHLPICEQMAPMLKEAGLDDKLWLVGGVIPEEDRERLLDLGVDGVFPTGSEFDEIAGFIRENCR